MNNEHKPRSATASHNQRWTVSFIASMALIGAGWLMLYQAHPAAPSPLGTPPGDGWWGWFDQGQYLKITSQFAAGDWFNPDKYYPPLYPAIPAAIGKALGSTEAYMLTDLALCLTFFGGLFLNFRAYLNPLIALGGVILMYGITSITYEQWVIPWTTNLSSAILIAISLLLSWEYHCTRSRQLWMNWRASAALWLTAMMIWVRPFEIIPAALLSIGLLALQTRNTLFSDQPQTASPTPFQKAQRLLPIIVAPGIAFASTVALYVLYNLRTFGSWEPSYSKTINSMGFSPWDLSFKFISLATDSSVYGIDDGHLSHALPLFIPLAVLSVISLFLLAFPQKILVFAALTSFVSYLSFNDLAPTGLFTFNNIHYFTWSIAVMGVATIAALSILIRTSIKQPKFRRRHLPILAGCWTITSITLAHAQPQTNTIQLSTFTPTITCTSERTDASNIYGKAAQFQLQAQQPTAKKSITQTRLLELNVGTNSNPTQVHLAHQDQIDLTLNGTAMLYRKDWRLVNRKEKGGNKLSILLNQPIDAYPLDGMLTVGKQSNINLKDVDFNQHRCTSSEKLIPSIDKSRI
jgi:hypothetical protein